MLLSSATLVTLRRILLSGLAIPGIGVAGSAWIPESISGNGDGSAISISDSTAITAYLYQEKPTGAAMAAPSAIVGEASWILVVVSGSVSIGQIVRSSEDGRRVQIKAQRPDPLYPTYVVEAV
jgi:hypothetical protein